MNQRIAFYITNHGYGHASRNAAIIEKLLDKSGNLKIWIKSDAERTDFLKRNLRKYSDRIIFEQHYRDVGFLLKEETLEVDVNLLYEKVCSDVEQWPFYIMSEKQFLKEEKIDIIISDVIPWVLIAAKEAQVTSLLLCNFTWYEMYKKYLPEELCQQYFKAYNSADKIFLYALGNPDIEKYYSRVQKVSLISRAVNPEETRRISGKYVHPIIFVSVGKSISINKTYDVSDIQATFITTAGVELTGNNVIKLPSDMINTQDYIMASDYVISKTGWSTLGEIFLNKKKAAVIARGNNPEDNAVVAQIREKNCGIVCTFDDLTHINEVIRKMDTIDEAAFSCFSDDCDKLAEYILTYKAKGVFHEQ